jgi:hypothetical protein
MTDYWIEHHKAWQGQPSSLIFPHARIGKSGFTVVYLSPHHTLSCQGAIGYRPTLFLQHLVDLGELTTAAIQRYEVA